ncbi:MULTISPECIES: LexA family protein [Providencia]|uniref:LexA family protein n=1 Tax=Providencia TaxID=586 RepID=UPI000DE72411|nr:S24 family peptidase [Providencia sp. PROV189]SST04534.1 Repressor protein C2 [Acinetobacter baumannii]
MNFDKSFPRRVSMARNAIGLTQSELAKKVGVVPRQIAAYEGGEAKPRINALNNLAMALGTQPEWLTQGEGSPPELRGVRQTVTLPLIPVVTSVQAANFSFDEPMVGVEYIPSPLDLDIAASEKLFALKIEGESMCTNDGISFPQGATVIFNPSIEPINGDFVLCRLNETHEVTFKELFIEQSNKYLKPLNKNYPDILIGSNATIIGVAVYSIIDLQIAGRRKALKIFGKYCNEDNQLHDIDKEKSLSEKLDKIESMLKQLLSKK